MQRVTTPQPGEQYLFLPREPLGVLHGPLIHLAQSIMLCWSVHHSSLDREFSRPKGHSRSLREDSIPALPSHLPGHLVSSLISWEADMSRYPLEGNRATQGAKLLPQAPEYGVVFQLTPLQGCQG